MQETLSRQGYPLLAFSLPVRALAVTA